MQQYNFNNNYGAFGNFNPNVPPPDYFYSLYKGHTPKSYFEKKGLKRAAFYISLALVALSLISEFWVYGYLFFADSFGMSREEAVSIIYDPAFNKVISVILSMFMFTFPFILIFKVGGYRISDLVPLGKPEKDIILPLFLIGISFCSLSNIATGYIQSFFDIFNVEYSVDFGEDPEGFFGFMLSIISFMLRFWVNWLIATDASFVSKTSS